jgi:hypothetical protein
LAYDRRCLETRHSNSGNLRHYTLSIKYSVFFFEI